MKNSLANKENRLLGLRSHVKCLEEAVFKLDEKLKNNYTILNRLEQIGKTILKNPTPTTENINRLFFHFKQFDIKINRPN